MNLSAVPLEIPCKYYSLLIHCKLAELMPGFKDRHKTALHSLLLLLYQAHNKNSYSPQERDKVLLLYSSFILPFEEIHMDIGAKGKQTIFYLMEHNGVYTGKIGAHRQADSTFEWQKMPTS